MKYIFRLLTLLAIFILNTITVTSSGSTTTSEKTTRVRKEWGSLTGKNYACTKGSDTHCKTNFGKDYCCA